MFKVKVQAYNDLTAEEKKGVTNKYADYIKVEHNGKTILLKSDEIAQEDVRFDRDLAWVIWAIEMAYGCGVVDATQEIDQKDIIRQNIRQKRQEDLTQLKRKEIETLIGIWCLLKRSDLNIICELRVIGLAEKINAVKVHDKNGMSEWIAFENIVAIEMLPPVPVFDNEPVYGLQDE